MDEKYSNGLENFSNDVIKYLYEARQENVDESKDFTKQQDLYGKYAHVYDESVERNDYQGHKLAAKKLMELYPNKKDIKILDFGCGTGVMANFLCDHGYKNVDGLDPCKELLNVARSKGVMREFFELGSTDDDSVIPSGGYDVVASSGVFYASPSHPGFECIPKICRYVKPGGYIIICTGKKYLDNITDSDNKIIEDLVQSKKISMKLSEVFDNYRKPMHAVEGDKSVQAALLVYQIL